MVLTERRLLVGWCGNIVIIKFYDKGQINIDWPENTLRFCQICLNRVYQRPSPSVLIHYDRFYSFPS